MIVHTVVYECMYNNKSHGKWLCLNEIILTESLLKNRSSFLYGRKPAGTVPVYALVKNCIFREDARLRAARNTPMLKQVRKAFTLQDPRLLAQRQTDSTNNLRAQIISREQMRQVKHESASRCCIYVMSFS